MKRKWELSGIFVLSALLTISLLHVAGKVKSLAVIERRQYPNLYAPVDEVSAPSTGKVIYFTFDDGPSANTEIVLNMLKEEGIPATFFVSGQNADQKYAATCLNRILAEGHTMGLHTYTHEFSEIYASADSYLADLDRLNNYIIETTGHHPQIFRFAGGSRTQNASRETIQEIASEITRRGYLYYDWDIPSGDDTATAKPVEELAATMLQGVENAGERPLVILCHDNPVATTTAEAVRMVAHALREDGWQFAALNPSVSPVQFS